MLRDTRWYWQESLETCLAGVYYTLLSIWCLTCICGLPLNSPQPPANLSQNPLQPLPPPPPLSSLPPPALPWALLDY